MKQKKFDYKRTRSITMTDAQWTRLKKLAAQKGLTISSFIRLTLSEV